MIVHGVATALSPIFMNWADYFDDVKRAESHGWITPLRQA